MKSESSREPILASKGALAIQLSKLGVFKDPQVRAEQYPTDPEIAAEVLWNAHMRQDIGKVSVDLGAGTGILGIGLLLLGAKKVVFVESDPKSSKILQENLAVVKSEYSELGEAEVLEQDISQYLGKCDFCIQNPPFGTKVRHADREFLAQAVKVAPVIYSFHKSDTRNFLEAFSSDENFKITDEWKFQFPLKSVHSFHKRKIHRINVSCFRLEKQGEKLPKT